MAPPINNRMELLTPETLLHLLMFLTPLELKKFEKAYPDLMHVVRDSSLWVSIDCKDQVATIEQARYLRMRVNARTLSFIIRSSRGFLTPKILKPWKQFDRLTILALEHQTLNGAMITLRDFPASLKELSLSFGHFSNVERFFEECDRYLVQLRVLIIESSDSLSGEALGPISLLPSLEMLSLRDSRNIGVAEGSEITGFKNLVTLNIYNSGLANYTVYSLPPTNLKEIYLQYPIRLVDGTLYGSEMRVFIWPSQNYVSPPSRLFQHRPCAYCMFAVWS